MKHSTKLIKGFFDNMRAANAAKEREIEVALTNIVNDREKYKDHQMQAINDNPVLKKLPKGTKVTIISTYEGSEQKKVTFTPEYTTGDNWSCFDSWFYVVEYTPTRSFGTPMTWEDLLRKLLELSIGTLKFIVKIK